MLQGAFLHPHFEILEVKNNRDSTPQATTLRLKNQERRSGKINNNLTRFGSGVIVRRQESGRAIVLR
jgi:hypothetical protein